MASSFRALKRSSLADDSRHPVLRSLRTKRRGRPLRQAAHRAPERHELDTRACRPRLGVPLTIGEPRPGSASPPVISAGVSQNPEAPTRRLLVAPKPIPLHERLDHRVLDEVLTVVPITGQGAGNGDEVRVLAPIEILEGPRCRREVETCRPTSLESRAKVLHPSTGHTDEVPTRLQTSQGKSRDFRPGRRFRDSPRLDDSEVPELSQ